ncbi:hypothetical protein SPRG_00159 [Saprolegnia parasitica CBS 223.65]|uniref:Uncharacterized protein n=1 Tax=Saprolegnia parasitica (strain CBS 223.65) TaxID=695850 RepID=A0A067D1E4_SAPPC|nr:hypothetical protein SPRG_00159 [Saprolegnia parasitica CBS 223.65]KDO35310.1 hypothetical protein SPRG_00159 [Saprolegnia parasitica CBS 223.65]|eukprot:XP_012193657.1 hypothetical protein SPRG_00159 [Saprolegnia parasitica CBS 223.65]
MSFNSGSHPPTLLALSSSSSTRALYGTHPKSVDEAAPEDSIQTPVGRAVRSASPGIWAINYLLLEFDTLIRLLREKRTT